MVQNEFNLTLPIYYTLERVKGNKVMLVGLNNYRNWHHSISNKIKHHYSDIVGEIVGDRKFKKIKVKYIVYARRVGTDGPNIRSVIEKFFLDGLVNCGAIKDDSIQYVVADSSEYFIDRENPRIVINISEAK